MTNPYSDGNDDFPRYQPTDHPEDNPSFGGLPSYGGSHESNKPGYAGYGASPGEFRGKPSAIDALSFGFKATLGNWKLWVLGSLLVGVILFAVTAAESLLSGPEPDSNPDIQIVFQLASTLVGVFVGLLAMRLALFQIDDSRTGWGHVGKKVRWWQPFVIMLVISVISSVVFFLAIGGGFFALFNDADSLSEEELLSAVLSVLGVGLVLALISVLLQPLFMLMQWFAADGDGVGEAVKRGFAAGKANYGQLLLLTIVNFFILLGGVLLLGIGLIVASPVTFLAQAHLFRQCAGRNTLPQA